MVYDWSHTVGKEQPIFIPYHVGFLLNMARERILYNKNQILCKNQKRKKKDYKIVKAAWRAS